MADKKYANEHPRNKKKDKSPVTRAEKMANYKALSKPWDYGRQLPPFLKSVPIKYNKAVDDFETMQKERFMYKNFKKRIKKKKKKKD